jgi:hypothetical protein
LSTDGGWQFGGESLKTGNLLVVLVEKAADASQHVWLFWCLFRFLFVWQWLNVW